VNLFVSENITGNWFSAILPDEIKFSRYKYFVKMLIQVDGCKLSFMKELSRLPIPVEGQE